MMVLAVPAETTTSAREVAPEMTRAAPVVADLHVDPLMWHRDLVAGDPKAQVDLPKLVAGGVGIAIFGVVTSGLPVLNGWRLSGLRFGWPREARRSCWHAAQFQIDQLHDAISRSAGRMVLVKTAAEIETALAQGRVAAMLGIEGAQALDGDPRRVQTLADQGAVYMGIVHLPNNELAGTSYPLGLNRGLTELGRQVLKEMERTGMFVDLAHAGNRSFWEILEATRAPVMCSHTGVKAVENSWRNLDDAQIKAIADRGGVIGIMVATNFLGGKQIARWVEHVDHAVAVAGVDHVALGSDLDGFIPLPKGLHSVADTPKLTQALLDAGYSAEQVGKIMGGNFLDMMRRFKPGTPAEPSMARRRPQSGTDRTPLP